MDREQTVAFKSRFQVVPPKKLKDSVDLQIERINFPFVKLIGPVVLYTV